MHRLAIVLLATLASVTACKKESPGDSRAQPPATTAPSPNEAPTGPQRTGAVPKLRTAPSARPGTDNLPPEANPPGAPVISGTIQTDRDVRYIDEKVGNGPAPVSGKKVSVHYSGWLPDGTPFDSSLDRGEPIKFTFDGGQVIKGWDIGLSSMRVGGKRRLMIPAELAYGDRGAGGVIPPGSMLVFDVELMEADE